jgi:2Fe-2S ferredoxin
VEVRRRERVLVTFLPEGRVCEAEAGETLLDVALENGIALEHECGGNCACTTCRVAVESGAESLSAMEEVEADRLETADDPVPSSRLACQALIMGDVTVRLLGERGGEGVS